MCPVKAMRMLTPKPSKTIIVLHELIQIPTMQHCVISLAYGVTFVSVSCFNNSILLNFHFQPCIILRLPTAGTFYNKNCSRPVVNALLPLGLLDNKTIPGWRARKQRLWPPPLFLEELICTLFIITMETREQRHGGCSALRQWGGHLGVQTATNRHYPIPYSRYVGSQGEEKQETCNDRLLSVTEHEQLTGREREM